MGVSGVHLSPLKSGRFSATKKVPRSNDSGKHYAIPACWRLWEVLQLKNWLSIYQTDLIIWPLKKIKTLTLETLKEMATHFSILAWEIPWTEKPGGIQSIGQSTCPQRVVYNWVTNTLTWSETKISTLSAKGQTDILVNSPCQKYPPQLCHRILKAWWCFDKALFLYAEIWISYNFHMSWNNVFLLISFSII